MSYVVKSPMLKSLYKKWQETATSEQLKFVDEVFLLAGEHYEAGGDVVVETMEPTDILKTFKSLKEVRSYCGIWVEQNLNARWGEDTDPQLDMSRKFEEWMIDDDRR